MQWKLTLELTEMKTWNLIVDDAKIEKLNGIA